MEFSNTLKFAILSHKYQVDTKVMTLIFISLSKLRF